MFRKIQPTGQNANNTLKILKTESGCCGSTGVLKKCQYDVTISSFANVASFTIDDEGTTKTIAFDATITDYTKIKDAVIAKARENGYILDEDPLDIQVTESGGDVTIKIWGEMKVTKFTNASASDSAMTEKCTVKLVSDYETTYAGSTNPVLVVDGSASTVTGAFANNGTGAAALETALATALSGEQSVTCTYDVTIPAIRIKIVTDSGQSIKFDNKQLQESNVTKLYTA